MTGFIGVCLLLMMTILASLANEVHAFLFRNIISVAAILGILWMCWPNRHLTILSIENKPSWIQKPQYFFRHTAVILFGQIVFFLLSLFFLCFIEIQTRSNYRLYALPESYFLDLIQKDILNLYLWPWISYAIMGLGIGYFCLVKDRIPNLFNALIPPNPKQPLLFFHNYFSTVVFMTMIIPFLIVIVMIILLLSDGLNGIFGFTSFYENPIRSLFLAIFVGILLNRLNARYLPEMIEKRHSLGRILTTYAIFTGLLLWWISWLSYIAFSGIPEEIILASTKAATKSLVLQKLSPLAQDTRLTLLVWSWWLIWLPFMSSFIARFTIGKNLTLSFIASVLFPVLTLIMLRHTNQDTLQSIWHNACLRLQNPTSEILLAGLLAALLFITLKRTHSVADLLRGFMQDFGKMRRFPLTSWISSTIYCVIAYLISTFLVGWLGLQILMTIAAWFMTTLALTFVLALYFEINVVKNIKKLLLKSKALLHHGH